MYRLYLLEIQEISDIYVSLTNNRDILPQKYTIHCIFTHLGSEELTFGMHYYMEGMILSDNNENNTCSNWPGVSCVHAYHTTSPNKSETDSQLHVMWNASTVMAPASVPSPQSSVAFDGDHHFSCSTDNDYIDPMNITIRGK